MNTFLKDISYAARMLAKRPGFTAAALLSLALGIGAATAIFSVVDAVLLRALPYPQPERIVQLREVSQQGTQMAFAEPNFLDVRARNRSLEAVAQYAGGLRTVTGGSEPSRARVFVVSGDFFKALGVPPSFGRTFLPEDSRADSNPVAVVGYGFWQRLLGGRGDFNGIALKIDNRSYTVIGVMPPGFGFPQNADVWTPRELLGPQTSRTAHNWQVIARLRADVTPEQARADLSNIGRQFKQEHGANVDAVDLAMIPLQESLVGNVRKLLLIIFAAVGVLLLVACANVANLLLAQVTVRQKEFAVRAALGATRLRLARQFITENLLLALAAGALGVLLSYWGVDLLIGLNQRALPRMDEIGVNARVMSFTLGLSLLVAAALGLVPVFRLSTRNLHDTLKEAGRSQSAQAAGRGLRSLLVVAQLALTLVLLTGAGLLGRSFYHVLQTDPGFRTESAVVMELSLPRFGDNQRMGKLMKAFGQLQGGSAAENPPYSAEYEQRRAQQTLFYQQLLERLNKLPGVVSAGGTNTLPMTGAGSSGTFLVEGNRGNTGYADYRQVSPGYFAAMGIPLRRGRLFDQSDKLESQHVALISQSLAQKQWPGEDPVGKRIQFGNMDGDLRLLQVIGVVGDTRDYGLEQNSPTVVYTSAYQRPPSSNLSIVVRAQAAPAALIPALRRELQSLNPELPVSFRMLDQVVATTLDQRRFSLVILGVFAGVALLLAMMGIYGVMSYTVSQCTQEIGVRMALGATVGGIMKLILAQGGKMIALGVAAGIAGSYALTRLLAGMLYGVTTTDPATFAGVALLLALVALVACWLPARRAAKVDPMVALRCE